jgi:hypothetical protein
MREAAEETATRSERTREDEDIAQGAFSVLSSARRGSAGAGGIRKTLPPRSVVWEAQYSTISSLSSQIVRSMPRCSIPNSPSVPREFPPNVHMRCPALDVSYLLLFESTLVDVEMGS